MNADELADLESAYEIDRGSVRRVLEESLDDQRKMEGVAEKHSCELPAWVDLAAKLEARRSLSSTAVEQVIAETMELDEAVFGGVSRADCVEIVRALGLEFDRALRIRIDSARLLIAFAQAYRSEGYQGSEIVDRVSGELVRQLVEINQVPVERARKYVDRLAQECGAVTPALGSPHARFPDLTAMFASSAAVPGDWRTSGKSFEEIANDIQQTALGLWPKLG